MESSTSQTFALLLRTILALGLVTALLWVVLRWGLPRLFRWRLATARSMAMIDRFAVGNDRTVCVMKVLSRYYLMGVTTGSIRILAELDKEEVETAYPELGASRGQTSTSGGGAQ